LTRILKLYKSIRRLSPSVQHYITNAPRAGAFSLKAPADRTGAGGVFSLHCSLCTKDRVAKKLVVISPSAYMAAAAHADDHTLRDASFLVRVMAFVATVKAPKLK
jgi:hypothetical protein